MTEQLEEGLGGTQISGDSARQQLQKHAEDLRQPISPMVKAPGASTPLTVYAISRHKWNDFAIDVDFVRAEAIHLLWPSSTAVLADIDSPKQLADGLIDKAHSSHKPIGAVEIFSHGAPNGQISLGKNSWKIGDEDFAADMHRIKPFMTTDATITIDGCQSAAGPDAEEQFQGLSNATGTKVRGYKWNSISLFIHFGPSLLSKPQEHGSATGIHHRTLNEYLQSKPDQTGSNSINNYRPLGEFYRDSLDKEK